MSSNPTSYCYSIRDECFKLYLGGLSTLEGLMYFPQNAQVSQIELWADDATAHYSSQNELVSEMVGHISGMPEHIGIVDFSCKISAEVAFSTHDDSECHFDSPSADTIRGLVRVATPDSIALNLWEVLNANLGWYIVPCPDGSLAKYRDFDSLLASRDTG